MENGLEWRREIKLSVHTNVYGSWCKAGSFPESSGCGRRKTEGFLELGDGEFVLPAAIIRGKILEKPFSSQQVFMQKEVCGDPDSDRAVEAAEAGKVKRSQLVLVKVLNREDF